MNVDFAQFFAIWCVHKKGWTVPEFQVRVCDFLEDMRNWDNQEAVLQVFRSAGKSTVVGAFLGYLLARNPSLRLSVVSADTLTARKVVADTKEIILNHPLTKGRMAISRKDNKSASFSLMNAFDPRNSSLSARGILANATGSRADILIFDDVEVPKNCDTAQKREKLREKIAEAANLLDPNMGYQLFIGTPHTYDSIYPETIAAGASKLTIPLLNEYEGVFPNITGTTVWEDVYTAEALASRQRRCLTAGNFESQYLLKPKTLEDSTLNPEKINTYSSVPEYTFSNNTHTCTLEGRRITGVSAFWDVSTASGNGDASVLAIVFQSDDGRYFIQETMQLFGDIETQSFTVVSTLERYRVGYVSVETNGVGAFVPSILTKYAKKHGIGVNSVHAKQNKRVKILEAFSVPLLDGFLYANERVMETRFYDQLTRFRPEFDALDHDDFIDAVASAIHEQPYKVGLKPVLTEKNQRRPWRAAHSTSYQNSLSTL